MPHRWRLSALVFGVGLTILATSSLTSVVQARATLQIVATGLFNPRGLNFAPNGELFVAEAGTGGTGPCVVNGTGATVCFGTTGRVSQIALGVSTTPIPVVTGLPSLAGATGSEATGPHDVDFQGMGKGWVTIGLGTDPGKRINDPTHPDFPTVGFMFGRLVRFKPNGKWSFEEDLSGFEALANPDGNAIDSNPYGILAGPGRVVFTDAGGNALNAVAANGSISNLASFPNRVVPLGPFGPPGATIPMQAVPTTVTQGPDGALYVGQLTGFPFPLNGARVYRVPSNGGTPTIYAEGFTKIIDIAFAKDGSLYVVQISSANGPPPAGPPTGALLRVPPGGGAPTTIVAPGQGLTAPGGIALGPDGALYLTNLSTNPGGGQVVRIVP